MTDVQTHESKYYRISILRLMICTYYDFEKNQPLTEAFDVKFSG